MSTATFSQSAVTADRHPAGLPDRAMALKRAAALALLALSLCFAAPMARAQSLPAPDSPRPAPDPIEAASAQELRDALDARFFDLAQVRDGRLFVPRVSIASLPDDLRKTATTETRKDLFLRAVLPLVLLSNERILADRARLLSLIDSLGSERPIAASDLVWLDRLAERYGTEVAQLDELSERVDVVPVSLTLAQAIEESGWGTSRSARQDNALFGERDGAPGEGLRAFPDLMSSVEAYMRNLNTHEAYAGWREERATQRRQLGRLDPHALTDFLADYAENRAYARNLRRLIASNELERFDGARLASGTLAERRPFRGVDDTAGGSG